MTLEELYDEIGGNYKSIEERLRKKERIDKIVRLFLKDNSYDTFVQALEEGDAEEAFRAIHTLKGVCLNLSFDALYGISSEITEDLREGNLEKGKEALEELTACYQKHLRGILVYTEH